MIEKVTFTNSRGQSIELSNRRPFLLQSVEGKADVGADIQIQKAPYQDGSSYIDSLLQPRSITLNVSILAYSQDGLIQQRQLLASVFNPKLGPGKLVYSKGKVQREINAVVENVPVFAIGSENNGMRFQRTIINLLCPSPFWEDINSENYKLEDFVSNFRFSFHFPVRFATRGDSKILINKGDVPTPIKVEFRGPVVNPKITNLSTGEFIKVNREIPKGYKLILETSFGNKRVEIIGPDGIVQNAFHYIDLASTFFNLDVGENRFAFITDSGSPEVYVEYKHRYLSV
ncbi:phage tail family protein [Lysinibacillus fusiformis]|uniref:phage tail family protein n=1 Tax=Lysinibacillus fusiformis TaxID=28031 RepID=UPI002D766B25|nr:phage tail family protein [Lysinibacillus fusiformis]WRS99941.1 phage tail family protein [Lysinibacillus fusiformis]